MLFKFVIALLRELVSYLIENNEEKWLTPDVITMLIDRYALPSPTLGTLSWTYVNSINNRWGEYDIQTSTLKVNKEKTRGDLKHQISTILHEIQHWNQHAAYVELVKEAHPEKSVKECTMMFRRKCNKFVQTTSNVDNPIEKDAREFAERRIDAASRAASRIFYREMMQAASMRP